jgi:hypothetical protein
VSLPIVVADRVEAFDSQCSGGTYTSQSPFFSWLQHVRGDPAVPIHAHCVGGLQTCRVDFADGYYVIAMAMDRRMRASAEFIEYLRPGMPEPRLHHLRGAGFVIPSGIPYATVAFWLTADERGALPALVRWIAYFPVPAIRRTASPIGITLTDAFPAIDDSSHCMTPATRKVGTAMMYGRVVSLR